RLGRLGPAISRALELGRLRKDQRESMEALRASEARYHALFECAPDGILISNIAGTYLDANASACRMFGYIRAEFIGLSATAIVTAEEIGHIAPALDQIKAGADYYREWLFRRKDGSVFPAEVIATAMPDGNLLAMIRDITERRQADGRIREQLAELLRWQEVMMDREDRVQALKAEVNALLARMSQPPRYLTSSAP
ncbi:MAG TPA: PAS domain S-box protein, partial [Lacunisphaera sp.]